MSLASAPYAVVEMHDSRRERAVVDVLEVAVLLSTREERGSAADEHWVDAEPVLVDETERGRLGSERGAADADVARPRLRPPPRHLLGQTAGRQFVAMLDGCQGRGEDDLRQRRPQRGELPL